MEIRELTLSYLTFWEGSCAEKMLEEPLVSSYMRRRNQWISANMASGLYALLMLTQGETAGFTIALPIERVPLPLVGTDYGVILCAWVRPAFATSKYKGMLIGSTVERLKHNGFKGIISMAFAPGEIPLWESFGFSEMGEFAFWSFPIKLMALRFEPVELPSLQRPVPLPPPRQKEYAIDVFAPSYCPFGVLLISKVVQQAPQFSRIAELRIHDTGIRDVVLRTGRVFGVFINGINVNRDILSGKSVAEVIEFVRNEFSAGE